MAECRSAVISKAVWLHPWLNVRLLWSPRMLFPMGLSILNYEKYMIFKTMPVFYSLFQLQILSSSIMLYIVTIIDTNRKEALCLLFIYLFFIPASWVYTSFFNALISYFVSAWLPFFPWRVSFIDSLIFGENVWHFSNMFSAVNTSQIITYIPIQIGLFGSQ